MTVRSVKSAEYSSDPQPSVNVTLGADDARRLKALTATVSKRSGDQNKVAMIAGTGSDRRLVTAPSVRAAITNGSMQISGLSAKKAKQLAHDLGGD